MSEYFMPNLGDDELMHWKYIKRERRNGKWVYYYNDERENAAQRMYERSRVRTARAMAERSNAESGSASDYIKADKKLQAAGKDQEDKIAALEREQVRDLPAKLISKGYAMVANLISNLTSKPQKATKKKQTSIVKSAKSIASKGKGVYKSTSSKNKKTNPALKMKKRRMTTSKPKVSISSSLYGTR